MTTLNARLTRRAFLGGAAAFGAAAMVSPKNAFADPTSADVQAQADEARQKLNSMREQLGVASANYNQAAVLSGRLPALVEPAGVAGVPPI